ncbi:hypothetical protein DYB34_002617 [Aphanomyces astaci]|uniref:Uncharacterized protein n=1 Tax=Aphanomyces astaci TaxID=112090 RepID=A0A3R7DJJ2_APHAT|nr:hypothetical protein DYB34_002617 [Aphanomyces astaci]
MIRIQEELEDKARGMHLQEKELQHKIEELQFLNTQKTSQLQKKDADLSKLYAQVQRLQGEMQHPTNGGNSTSADAIELNKLLPPAIDRKSAGTSSAAPLSSIDDHDASSKQLDALGRENKALQDRLTSLESQVRTRDAEIDRLGKQLKDSVSTKDYATIKAKYDLEAYQIAQDLDKDQLTRQVDLLNDQVAKYEQKLVDALPSQQRLESLTQELKHAQGLNDKYMEQLQLLQQRLQRIEQEHELCDAKQSELTMASDQAEKLVQKLQQQLDDTTLQVTVSLENALKATHYDKMSSANSVANLEAHVKVLTTELNQLKPKHAAVCQQLADESSNGKHWTKQRQALETELATLQSKCQAVARQLHQQSLANESQRSIDVQAQHASVHSEERVMLRRDNDALQVRVRRLELLRNELDVALRDAQAQGTSWKHQADHLQDQMTETLHDLAKANAQLNQVKMEVVHLQQDKTQLETQVADSRREIEKLAHMAPHEATAKLQESKWQKRVTEAVLSKQLVETQLSAAVAAKAGLEQRLAQAETKLRSADDRAIEINTKVSSLESELANVQSELASTKQSKLYFEAEYEAAMLAWTDQSKAFQTAQHDLDAADGAQRESARQIHDLQAALTASQTKCMYICVRNKVTR